jgi:hypothetical protein
VIITQFFEGVVSGHIASLNYTDGSIQLQNGPLIRISDPNGVLSAGLADYPFMTTDDVNPSITAFSCFPICVPRNANDLLAPLNNRGGRNFQNKWEYRDKILSGYSHEYRAMVGVDGVPMLRRTKKELLAGTYISSVNSGNHACPAEGKTARDLEFA